MLFLLAALALVTGYVFEDDFSKSPLENGWVQSDWKKGSGAGDFEHSSGKWSADAENRGLRTAQDARFYAITKKLPEVFDNEGKTLVFQFSVKHEQKIDCGGGYWKLIGPGLDQANFEGSSAYQVMFGPDICGYSTKRIHAILNHNGENLLTTKTTNCETDEFTHIYTWEIEADNTYKILIDGEEKASGSLYDDWEFESPKEINDPSASKPSDWVDERMIDDPEDTKTEDWDQEETIVDSDAEEPEDWDEEDDGEWEPPMIPNPEFKGEWRPKRIENPAYKGEWEHPQVENPDYVEVTDVYKRGPVEYIGMEVWQVKGGTIFDNMLLTDDKEVAAARRETIMAGCKGEPAAKEEFEKPDEEEEDNNDDEDEDDEEEEDDEIDEDDVDLEDLDKDEL